MRCEENEMSEVGSPIIEEKDQISLFVLLFHKIKHKSEFTLNIFCQLYH